MEVGDSAVDSNGQQLVPRIMERAACTGVSIHLPLDFLVADRCVDNATTSNRSISEGLPTGGHSKPHSHQFYTAVISLLAK